MRVHNLIFIGIFTTLLTHTVKAQNIIYQPEDSLRIEQLLSLGLQQPEGTNLQLFYARQFLGLPYVGKTLEANYIQSPQTAKEQLIINTRELDCTTFVETVCNLTITTLQGKRTFADYCRNLTLMRYQDGIIDGYASRNHYYSTAIDNMERHNIARELGPEDSPLFTGAKHQVINFMTTHPDLYPALCNPGGDQFLPAIRQAEEAITRTEYYIPTSLLGKSRKQLSCVQDGDILALVTDKAGLDVAHVTIAHWGEDGKLHFIHASSIRHKVVDEPLTVQQYQLRQKAQPGIRVIRLTMDIEH